MPARRIGQTATFLPEMRARRHPLERRLDLDLLVGEVLRRLVREQQRQLVDELAELLRRRRDVAQQPELVLDERVRRPRRRCPAAAARRSRRHVASCSRGSPGRAAASRRAPRCARRARRGPASSPSASQMMRADLAEVLLVEAAHRRRRRADADARRDRRRPLVERHGVAVDGQPDLVQPLLRVLARPVGRAQVELQRGACRCRP